MLDMTTEQTYELGTELFFDLRATGAPYVVSGFFAGEAKYTWTNGKQSVLEFALEKRPRKDLFVSMFFWAQMTDSPRVRIYVNDQLLGWYRTEQNQLDFIIPKEMIDSTVLQIRLELPDAVSPAELDASSSDTSVLCLGLYSMVIRGVQRGDEERYAFTD